MFGFLYVTLLGVVPDVLVQISSMKIPDVLVFDSDLVNFPCSDHVKQFSRIL